jgi:hypothetical protein
VGDWVSDDEIWTAENALRDTFVAMLDDELPASGYPRDQIAGLERDVHLFVSIDPQKLADEYERVYKAAKAVGNSIQGVSDLRQSIRYLDNWTGAAADEFKKQIDKMEIFCDEQETRLLRGVQGLAAAYVVAVNGRASFFSLLNATKAAGINEIDDQRKEDAKLTSALLFDMAAGLLEGDPKKMLAWGTVNLIEIGKDVVDRLIEGNDADQVMDSYRREADALVRSFEDALNHIAKDFGNQTSDAAQPSDMYKPLPPICDVGSPDFRWENFQDTVHDPGPIGPAVEEERKKLVAEKEQQSEIDRRLNPGGKRVV